MAWGRPLASYCGRAAIQSSALVVIAGLSAGAIRLLPWVLAREIPLTVTWPFAKALVAVAIETALLVGLPSGFAFGAGKFNERGEARALFCLGATPAALALSGWRVLLVLGAVIWIPSMAWEPRADPPGRLAAQLIEGGQKSCTSVTAPRAVLVPLVGVTWLCFPGRAPRVVGPLPGAARAWFSATALYPSDDLQRFELTDLRLATGTAPDLQLVVHRATITGLPSWGRSVKLPGILRAALLSFSAILLSLTASWLVLRRQSGGRLGATLSGAVPALVSFGALHWVDDHVGEGWSYLMVPVAGLLVAIGWALLFRLEKSFLSRVWPRPRRPEK
ncbi:MAG TPA: hypothetical protein VGJ84_14450 [Polyangiaceae bacterium]|jgi:hypothetical protein